MSDDPSIQKMIDRLVALEHQHKAMVDEHNRLRAELLNAIEAAKCQSKPDEPSNNSA